MRKLQLEIITQMLALATSAFGLVAALAWNTVVQTFIQDYIKPFLTRGDSIVFSQLIYAIIVTVLVVTVTLYLSRLKEKLES